MSHVHIGHIYCTNKGNSTNPLLSTSQLFGSEDCYLWLVASWDRRVSVWSADWKRDLCQLVDWLTFPGPSFAPDGTKLRRGHKVLKSRPTVCKECSKV